MRILLLGATGNLGLRLIPALLAHKHTLIIYVRNPSKLHSLVPESLTSQATIVVGDATDSEGIRRALIEHNCDGIVDTAGNQVLPWTEYLLGKIAKAVSDAAIAVGKERGKPLRAWFIGGLTLLRVPGTDHLVRDLYVTLDQIPYTHPNTFRSLPRIPYDQHQGTLDVLKPIQQSSLRWSIMCIAFMYPVYPAIEPLESPRTHSLISAKGMLAGWADLPWTTRIPLIGWIITMVLLVSRYTTNLEDVADFIAEDLKLGSEEFIVERVGIKQKTKTV